MEIVEARGIQVILNSETGKVVVWNPEKQVYGLASPYTGVLDVLGDKDEGVIERFVSRLPEELAGAVLRFIMED